MLADDYDERTREEYRGPQVECDVRGPIPADDCQRCWVEGYVMKRGDGVGCDVGQKRRETAAREAKRMTQAEVREVLREMGRRP